MADPVHAFDADGTPSPGAQTALDGKANVGHTHTWDSIGDKPTTFPPAAHNHDSAYAAKPGEWIVLTLTNGWEPYIGGGGYYQGLRARATPLGIQINGTVKGSGTSEIAVLPATLGVPASAQWDARGNGGVSTVEVSEGSGSRPALKHRAGSPAQTSYLSINEILPLI